MIVPTKAQSHFIVGVFYGGDLIIFFLGGGLTPFPLLPSNPEPAHGSDVGADPVLVPVLFAYVTSQSPPMRLGIQHKDKDQGPRGWDEEYLERGFINKNPPSQGRGGWRVEAYVFIAYITPYI